MTVDALEAEKEMAMGTRTQIHPARLAIAFGLLTCALAAAAQTAPETVDWSSRGAVTSVKLEDTECHGSAPADTGWALATAAALEGAWVLQAKNSLTELKPNRADFDNMTSYGLDYTNCDNDAGYASIAGREFPKNALNNWQSIETGNEEALRQAVARGRGRAKIDASNASFSLFSSGLYDESNCSSSALDHYVTIVGYGVDKNGKKYWLVKNDQRRGRGVNADIIISRGNG